MIAFLHQLPHLEAYGNPQYFLYLIVAVLPIFIGKKKKKRFPVYEALVSFHYFDADREKSLSDCVSFSLRGLANFSDLFLQDLSEKI